MKSIELIVRVIIRRDNKILLCKNNEDGHYFLPGGHVEFGDSLIDTIYKELQEEIGLSKNQINNLSYKSYLENVYVDNKNKHHELNMIFTAILDHNLKTESKEDHISFEWILMNDIQNIDLLPKEIIDVLQ